MYTTLYLEDDFYIHFLESANMSSGFLSKAKMHAKTIAVVTVFFTGAYGVFKAGKKIQSYSQGTSYRLIEEMDDFMYNKEMSTQKTTARNRA